ncbi:uncharacterized protein [Nicotiana tomentosiformis]|uniref:uncharacterized protein n=1 Tax=Nicotiana tomentosiformis TaxID=4098 RepID=UPI00388C8ADF
MRFSELTRHAVWLVPTDRERIRRFVDGLTYQLQLLMTRERVSGATFDEVVDIARKIEMVRSQEWVRGRPKGLVDQVISAVFLQGGQFYRGRGRPYRHAQTGHPVHCGASSSHGSYSYHDGQSYLSALLPQSSSHAPLVQDSSAPGSSSRYSGARSSLQPSPSFTGRGCFECGDMGHIKRYCPRLTGGPAQQKSRPMTSAPIISPHTQPVRGGAQSVRGRPRGRGRSGGSQAQFYAIPARLDVLASDTVITSIVSVFHRGPLYCLSLVPLIHMYHRTSLIIWICPVSP